MCKIFLLNIKRWRTKVLRDTLSLCLTLLVLIPGLCFADASFEQNEKKFDEWLNSIIEPNKQKNLAHALLVLNTPMDERVASTRSLDAGIHEVFLILQNYKTSLEAAALLYQKSFHHVDTFFSFTLEYYNFLALLYQAAEALPSEKENIIHRAQSLELSWPCSVVHDYLNERAMVAQSEGFKAYDHSYTFKEESQNQCRLLPSVRQLTTRVFNGALLYPERNLVTHQLKLSSLKYLFDERATLRSYLFSDELSGTNLDLEQLHAGPYIVGLKTFSEMSVRENLFREKQLLPDLEATMLHDIAHVIAKSSSEYQERLKEFLVSLGNQFLQYVDSKKLNTAFTNEKSLQGMSVFSVGPHWDLALPPFLSNETPQKWANRLKDKVLDSPDFLTQMTASEFKLSIMSMVQQIRAENIEAILVQDFFDFSDPKKTQSLQEDLKTRIQQFVVSNIPLAAFDDSQKSSRVPQWESLNAELDKAISNFITKIHDQDYRVMLSRYQLAAALIDHVTRFAQSQEKIDHILHRIKAGKTEVDTEDIPQSPDPAIAFTVLSFKPNPPSWYREVLGKYFSTNNALSQVTKPSEALEELKKALKSGMIEGLVELKRIAGTLNTELLSVEAIQEIKRLNTRFKKRLSYRWNSPKFRLTKLYWQAVNPHVKAILYSTLALAATADAMGASSFEGEIFSWARELLDDKEASKVREDFRQTIQAEIAEAEAFKNQNYHLIRAIALSDEGKRSIELRYALKSRGNETLVAYYAAVQNEVFSKFPGLFMAIDLPETIRQQTGFSRPVTFYELVIYLLGIRDLQCDDKGTLESLYDVIQGNHRMKCYSGAMPTLFHPYNSFMLALFEEYKKRKIDIHDIQTRGGIASTSLTPLSSSRGVLQIVQEALRDKLHASSVGFLEAFVQFVFQFDANKAPVREEFWPEQFKIRDFWPAYDEYQQKSRRRLSAQEQLQKVLVSALVAPYLRAALDANTRAIKELLDSKKDYLKVMVMSEAYKDYVQRAPQISDLLWEVELDATFWTRALAQAKAVTSGMRGLTNNYPFFVAHVYNLIPASIQTYTLNFMILANALDLGVDVAQLIDYRLMYGMAEPFAHSGMLTFTGSLFPNPTLAAIGAEYKEKAMIITNRLPWDIWVLSAAFAHRGSVRVRTSPLERSSDGGGWRRGGGDKPVEPTPSPNSSGPTGTYFNR